MLCENSGDRMEGEQTVILWGTGHCNYSVLVLSLAVLLLSGG